MQRRSASQDRMEPNSGIIEISGLGDEGDPGVVQDFSNGVKR